MDLLRRSHATSRSIQKVTDLFTNHLCALQYDVNQAIKAYKKIGTEVNLHFSGVTDRLGMVEASMATVPGNA